MGAGCTRAWAWAGTSASACTLAKAARRKEIWADHC
jgi:hypothetical protein